MKWRTFLYLMLCLPLTAAGQGTSSGGKLWQLTSIKGAAKLEGLSRNQSSTTNDLYNFQKSSLIFGGLQLGTTSFVWHPNFLTIEAGGEFNPDKRQEQFLVIPDQSEARTMKKLNFNAAFFRQKPINLSVFANYNESYNSRENLSNIRSTGSGVGSNFSFSNKTLPVTAGFLQTKWSETELQTGRSYKNERRNFQGNLSKSFSSRDNTVITYSHDNFDRIDANLFHINNISDYIILNNNISLDKKRKYNLFSNGSWFDQTGNETFSRTQANEQVILSLLPQLSLSGGYGFTGIRRQDQDLRQHNISAILKHRLYQSLFTSLNYEYNNIDQTFYGEINNKAGFDIQYEKVLPASGRLTLGYSLSNLNQKRTGESQLVRISHEEHILNDGGMVLLSKPYIELASVTVKDITGTIIYQEGFDYVLTERNKFIEIQRMPGGQIPEGFHVFVDYLSIQPGSYRYDATFSRFSADLSFFNRLIDVYYQTSKQDYHNLETSDFLTLNYFDQNLIGARFEYRFINGGVEIDNYASTLVPYKLVRYFMQFQGRVKKKLLYSLYGNLRDYKIIDTERNQLFADLSGNIAYLISPLSKVNLELGYRKQSGRQIDLDLLTVRTEFTTSYRKLFFKVSVEFYRRTYLHEKVSFNGANFQIVRNFGWRR